MQVLEAVAAGIKREVAPLLEAVLAPQSGLHAFNFLANSVLACVDSGIADAMPGPSLTQWILLVEHSHVLELTTSGVRPAVRDGDWKGGRSKCAQPCVQ